MNTYKNQPENKFKALANKRGWKSTKRGWPDFMCWDEDGRPIAVEVKPRTASGRMVKLKQSQVDTLIALQDAGIDCYVSDGEVLEVFDRDHHR